MLRNNPWAHFTPYQSVSFTRNYLNNIYEKNGVEKGELKSYQNSYPFVYYLEHGKRHYALAASAPRELKPMLLFYGMTQLLKACLLTADPDYPKTTAVLAHGVTARKRKKRGYAFLEDEVKIQKNGLAAHFTSKLFHMKQMDGERFQMRELLQRIPELNGLFATMTGKAPFYKTGQEAKDLSISETILDDLHMTFPRYRRFVEQHAAFGIEEIKHTKNAVIFKPTTGITPFECHPFQFAFNDSNLYIPAKRSLYDYFPEVAVHFLLLYNLSMISRYETEWWSELFHHAGTHDLPFIDAFLELTTEKVPDMLGKFLDLRLK